MVKTTDKSVGMPQFMRLDAPVFARLAPARGFPGDLADSLVAQSRAEMRRLNERGQT
jgi:hypothetical protein